MVKPHKKILTTDEVCGTLFILDEGHYVNYGKISHCAIRPKGIIVVHNEGTIENTVICDEEEGYCNFVNAEGGIITNVVRITKQEFAAFIHKMPEWSENEALGLD